MKKATVLTLTLLLTGGCVVSAGTPPAEKKQAQQAPAQGSAPQDKTPPSYDMKPQAILDLQQLQEKYVGLAQAIIHNPDVLILDEPTAGLDPKQINETRDLIKGLAGDHTIILSTHILPEVEQTCQQVIIINRGKLVATDSVDNLQSRARGAGSVLIEVAGRAGALDASVVQRRLEQVAGVSRVLLKAARENRSSFEVESQGDHAVRGDLARAVVEAGWDLNELRSAAISLEEVFLQLTSSETADAPTTPGISAELEAVAGEVQE